MRLPWASDSLLIPNKTMGWPLAWRRGCSSFSFPPLSPSSPSNLAPRFCWSLGGGAAIYKGEWVGGMGLADTEAKENSQRKLKEPIFQQIIFLMISLQFIGDGLRVSLSREPGKNFPRERGGNCRRNILPWFMLNCVLTIPQGGPESPMILPLPLCKPSWHDTLIFLVSFF